MVEALAANVRKVAIELARYPINTAGMVLNFYLIFLMFFLGIQLIGDQASAAENTRYMIVSMTLWFLALMAMQGIGWEITQEATRGTLEQLYMSPIAPWRILLARMAGTVAMHLLVIAAMLVMAMATAGEWLSFDLLTLAPLLLVTVAGMLGVGFMVAGLALVFKQVQSVLQVAQFLFLALVSVPVGLASWLEALPAVRGSTMIRQAMTAGVTLQQFSPVDWLLLLVNAAAWLAAGVMAYRLAERRAFERGLLGQY